MSERQILGTDCDGNTVRDGDRVELLGPKHDENVRGTVVLCYTPTGGVEKALKLVNLMEALSDRELSNGAADDDGTLILLDSTRKVQDQEQEDDSHKAADKDWQKKQDWMKEPQSA